MIVRTEWQEMDPKEALSIYFQSLGLRCRFRQQGTRYYVTVINPVATLETRWMPRYTEIVKRFYPDAYCTSGGADRATFCLGTVFDMIKNAR